MNEVDEIHPSFQTHILVALRDLPVGALLCGTELANFDRGSAFLYHNSPNVAVSLPFPNLAHPDWRGHFSWNTLELLSYRLEGLIFPSVLLSARQHRWRTPNHWYPKSNIVLHFLGNGLCCGEVISPIAAGEELVRHFGLGAYVWSNTCETRGWIDKSAEDQAALLFGDMIECDEYFADCAFHDENDSRADLAVWYREDTFDRLAEYWVKSDAEEDLQQIEIDAQYRELDRMRCCDVNVIVNVIEV